MDTPFPITPLTILLLVQAVGSAFLALSLGTMFVYRRQTHLLFWAAAWLCNAIWLLVSGVAGQFAIGGTPEDSTAGHAGELFGWWHAALWLLGMYHFLRNEQSPPATAAASERGETLPVPAQLGLLALTAAFGLVADRFLSFSARNALLGTALAVVYLWSGIMVVRFWRSVRRAAASLLATTLLLYALGRIHYAGMHAFARPADEYAGTYGTYAALADFVLQTLFTVAVLVFVMDHEAGELREAIDRLEESEERFRLIFDHSGVGMTLLTRDGRFLAVNPALVRMIGFSADELRGRRLVDLLHQKDITTDSHATGPLPETPDLYEREKRYVRKDGQPVWARVVRVPIRNAAGTAQYYVGVLLDISERKRAEEALAANEARYRMLHQAANDGIHLCGENGQFHDVNPALCYMLNYDREDLLRLTLAEVAVDAIAVRRFQERILQHGSGRLETRLRRRDDREIDVEMSGARLELDGRMFLHGVCRDVTDRKRAESALQMAKEKLQEERDFGKQVLETASSLIFVVDPQGRILRFNAACAAVTGYREEDVRGQVVWEMLVPQREVAAVREAHERLVQDTVRKLPAASSTALHESHWCARDGEERLIAWRHSIVRDGVGAVRYVIGTGLDVTDQRRLEEQVRRSRKLETLGALVGGIAHDFNNQLTAVLGHLHMVLGDLVEYENQGAGFEAQGLREPLTLARHAAQRCADITQRLLTFSSGKVGPTAAVSSRKLLVETEQTLQREAWPDLDVRVQYGDEDEPNDPGLWSVSGDIGQLQQVLLNLVTNAREAMPRGGRLTLAAFNRTFDETEANRHPEARPGRHVEFSVSDSGIGMSPDVRAHLFEPFFTTKEAGQGAGMGLAMTYGIVKAHKGWITAESQAGKGTTFRVFLPAAEAVVGTAVEAPVAEGGPECVLIVDDEELVLGLAKAVMQRWGFSVLTASNGEEALDVYRRHSASIDVVILDYLMPKMTGLQVFEMLKAHDPDVCVVFSSGYMLGSDRDQLLAIGASGFIAKPYRPDELVRTVRQALDRSVSRSRSRSWH